MVDAMYLDDLWRTFRGWARQPPTHRLVAAYLGHRRSRAPEPMSSLPPPGMTDGR